ncbi:unnamed protein product [Didymodactylos carnosus]|uniref:Uncharacterized protein n=1 Tax=Didymodactylos carnosus TaxID=1234261 RepID=A0A813WAY9_9BILA|nr:unnamed protein product [Didymodactylos carnosus]CAF3646068.1 unnamed protein product [Didymodactylos carnosus]
MTSDHIDNMIIPLDIDNNNLNKSENCCWIKYKSSQLNAPVDAMGKISTLEEIQLTFGNHIQACPYDNITYYKNLSNRAGEAGYGPKYFAVDKNKNVNGMESVYYFDDTINKWRGYVSVTKVTFENPFERGGHMSDSPVDDRRV